MMPRTDRAAEARNMVEDVQELAGDLERMLFLDSGSTSLASTATQKVKHLKLAVSRLEAHCKAWSEGAIAHRGPQLELFEGGGEEPEVDLAEQVLVVLTEVDEDEALTFEELTEAIAPSPVDTTLCDVLDFLADTGHVVVSDGEPEQVTLYQAAPDALLRYRITEAVRAGGEMSLADLNERLDVDAVFDEEVFDEEACAEVERVLLAEVEAGRLVECDVPEGEPMAYVVAPQAEDAEEVEEPELVGAEAEGT